MKKYYDLLRTFRALRGDIIKICLWMIMICALLMPAVLSAQVVFNANHYKAWTAYGMPLQIKAYVQDQFLLDTLMLWDPQFLSNPVFKVHDGIETEIVDNDDHLTWYRADGQPIMQELTYVNQFESTAVTIDSVRFLLTPTQKLPHPSWDSLDHYKAYRVADARSLKFSPQVLLQDQFDLDSGFPEPVDSMKAVYFLTPALKALMEPYFPEPMWDSVTHFVAYEIFPKRIMTRMVNTQDQFGPHVLEVNNSQYLLVPSIKYLPETPPDTGKNHYKAWRTVISPFDAVVRVEDQFMADDVHLFGIEYLSNPVTKTHGTEVFEIIKPDNHLSWYLAHARDTLLSVEYTNQYESDTAVISEVRYLLVPTQKLSPIQHPPPESLDHYKAYSIINPSAFIAGTVLQDQFDLFMGGLSETIDSLRPVYFLTPASKNAEPTYDLVTHYVAYEIYPKQTFQYPVNTVDQFGGHEVITMHSDLLLVPTTKLSVGSPPDSLLSSVCGQKCEDLNGNGTCDQGEPLLSNWQITLTSPTGGITTTVTNLLGGYCFTGLYPGQYTISETVQQGWQQTGPPPPGTYTVQIMPGQNLTGYDFANQVIPDVDSLKNHYKTWRNIPIQFGTVTRVEDQFMTDSLDLHDIEFLSNPVKKTHGSDVFDIHEADYHLSWYRAEGKDTLLKITYDNQFEDTDVLIDSVRYLLVPAQRDQHPEPDSLDHYKAYRIKNPKVLHFTAPIILEDEFDLAPETIDSVKQAFFLTPAMKNMEQVYDYVTHYVAYEIFPKDQLTMSVITHDQFGSHEPAIMYSEFILVPTNKRAVVSPVDSISIGILEGWDLLSVPLIVSDYTKTVLFPTAISDAFAYEGAYVTETVLEQGKGYWLKFAGDGSVTLTGTRITNDSIDVVPGWNIVGSISDSVLTSSITSDPGGIITTEFFGYNGSYYETDTIVPGYGYWVKVSQAGKLILSTGSAAMANRINIVPTSEKPPLPPGMEERIISSIPAEYSLGQNYPNPFNPSTTIKFSLPENATVNLTVYNALSQTVAVLIDGKEIAAGQREVGFDASTLPSGIYFCRFTAYGKSGRNYADVTKMLILK